MLQRRLALAPSCPSMNPTMDADEDGRALHGRGLERQCSRIRLPWISMVSPSITEARPRISAATGEVVEV